MAGLLATGRFLRPAVRQQCACIRLMSGDPFAGGSPPNLTGGQYQHPTNDPPPSHQEITDWVKKETGNNWRSLGWSQFNPKVDREFNALAMFIMITIGTVGVGAFWAYSPRNSKQDWAIREAYLLLREREAAGVEPISRDLVDPEKILAALPSDEELKEAGVVINI